MGLSLEYFDGQTAIDEEEKEGLLIPTISTRGELDEFEQQNIEKAIQSDGTARATYLKALKSADQADYHSLLAFARS